MRAEPNGLRLCRVSATSESAAEPRDTVMTVRRQLNWTLVMGAVSAALLVAYLVAWVRIDGLEIARSDFTSTYVGATLLREGHGSEMYDQSLQTVLHSELDPADKGGNLPFVNPPLAAALAMPVSLLGLDAAYRVWSLVQLALLVVAVVVALRAAPIQTLRRGQIAAIALLALASMGTWAMFIQGQWDGVSALGLATAYASLRRGRPATAGVLLAVTSLIGKPQLALCLAAFVVGRRDWRLIAGGLAGLAVCAGLSVLIAGTAGVAGFLGGLAGSLTRWQLTTFVSLVGIGAAVTGSTAGAYIVAAIGGAMAMALAAALGSAVRARPDRLEAGLAGAAVLSVLASPHALPHDLALLVPPAAWCFAALAARRPRPAALLKAAILVWIALSAAAAADTVLDGQVPPGPLTPWVLIAAAALAVAVAVRAPTREPARPAPIPESPKTR